MTTEKKKRRRPGLNVELAKLRITLSSREEELRAVVDAHDKMARRFASEIAAAQMAARQYKERAERAERAVESIRQFVDYLRFDMADNNPCG